MPRPLVSLSHAGEAQTHRYWVLENPLGIRALTLAFARSGVTLTLEDRKGAHSIAMGLDHWIESETDMPGQDLHHGYALQPAKVVAGARWLDRDTLEMHWIFVESVFADTVVARFSAGPGEPGAAGECEFRGFGLAGAGGAGLTPVKLPGKCELYRKLFGAAGHTAVTL